MPTINDEVFGEMTLNERNWEKIETKKIFGKEKRIKLYADNCNGVIAEVQRKRSFNNTNSKYLPFLSQCRMPYVL